MLGVKGIAEGVTAAILKFCWRIARSLVRSKKADEPFSQADLDAITRGIGDQLTRLDDEAAFLPADQRPIPTQIEEEDAPQFRIRRPSLLQLARDVQPRQIIVLKGEPGSGKSLALRQLARELLRDVGRTSRVPIYLNLREWNLRATERHQIEESFLRWVRTACTTQTSYYLGRFFDESKFDQLYRRGRLILLLDSFDEIPAVIDSHHKSPTVRDISTSIASFVRFSGGCSAIIASRSYKSPLLGSLAHKVYIVKQFDDAAVREYARNSCHWHERLLDCIYLERPDLFVMSRYPFLLALLVHNANTHNGALPPNEYDLYNAFFVDRLRTVTVDAEDKQQAIVDALTCAELIAAKIDAERPAAASVSVQEFSGLDQEISYLCRCRLMSRAGDRLKFTHRRFLEFFTVRKILSGADARPSLASGYLDSNRDMLRLYGGVCSEAEAQELAAEAIRHIRAGQVDPGFAGYEVSLIALRFLRDTFRARVLILQPYGKELNSLIVNLWNSFDLMKQKHAAEHLCLLPVPVATRILAESLKTKCGWLWRAALFEARYVGNMQPWLAMHITRYASRLSDMDHLLVRRFLRDTHLTRGGELIDALQLNVDSVARIVILSSVVVGSLFVSPFALGIAFFSIALLLIWRVGERSFGAAMERMSAPSANIGATGLLAGVIPWVFFWEIVHLVFGHKTVFQRNMMVDLMFIGCAVVGAAALLLNNRIGAAREQYWDHRLDLGMRTLLQRFHVKQIDYLGAVKRNVLLVAMLVFVIGSTWFTVANNIVSGGHVIFLLVAAVSLSYVLAAWLVAFLKYGIDWFVMKRIKRNFQPNRECISQSLLLLHTDMRRFMFLNWVEENREAYVSQLASPSDDWPNGVRPKFKDYLLNNNLAILDERWRGLNRR